MHICQYRESDGMRTDNQIQKKRRDFLKTTAAGSAVALTGLSGCIGSTDDDGGDGEDGGTTDDGTDFDEVTLGVLEPFTGDFAELATERNQGETLAIDQVNASDEYDFEFDVAEYDTQLSSEDGVQAAKDAIESDGAQFLTGAISSSVALAINEVAANQQVVYTPGAADVSITGSNCNEYVFRFETNTAQIAEVTTQWLADKGWTNLHYQIADYAYGDSVLEEVDSRMSERSGDYERLGTTRSAPAAQNFDSAITEIEENVDAADALVVGATGGHLIRFLVQAAGRGLKEDIPIVTTTGSFRVVRGGAGSAAYDVYSGTRYVPSIDTGTNPQFVEDYQAEYDAPPDNFSRVGYGSVLMLANGIQEAGSKDPDDVRDVLPGMTHETIFGDVAFRECDQQASNPVWMGQNVAPEEGETAAVELLRNLDGEAAQPACDTTGCEL
jgi:branched-chain amino acid transport system substrate-binding protein